jgi:hypothetical protein
VLTQNQWEAIQEWTLDEALEAGSGATNTLAVLAQGDQIALVANGTVLAEVEDDSFGAGTIGLSVGSFTEGNVRIGFDNLALWTLDESSPALPVDDSPETLEPIEEGEEFAESTARIDEILTQDPTFSDDFRRDQGYWDTAETENSLFVYEQRSLHIEVTTTNWIAWSTLRTDGENDTVLSDFYAEVDLSFATRPAGAAGGLAFRLGDPSNLYLYSIDAEGSYLLQKQVDGTWSDLAPLTASPEIDTEEGAVNTIGVLAEGDVLALTINGVVVAEVEDADLGEGSIGLTAIAYAEPDVNVAFDNFRLWELSNSTGQRGDEAELAAATARVAEVAAQEAAFSDDFQADQGTWDLPALDNASFFYNEDALHVEISNENWFANAALMTDEETPTVWEDFYAEVDVSFVQQPSATAAGLLFRHQDSDDFYLFAIDPTGFYKMQKRIDMEWEWITPWTESDRIDTAEGAVNRVGVLAEGDAFSLTINGDVVEIVEDADLDAGSISVMAEVGEEPPAEATFDNFSLWSL